MIANPEQNCFLDTNVLLYAFDLSAGTKHDTAVEILSKCWHFETGHLSIQVLQELFLNITRKVPRPLDIPTARQLIADLAQWHVHSPDADDLLQAIDLQERYQLSFWDAMIIQSASRLHCRQLISEDLNHGQAYGEVQVINPFNGQPKWIYSRMP